MKNIHIIGKDPLKVEELKNKLEDEGYLYVETNPDIVVGYGGDGMFLISERIFPGVPKILIRDSDVGNHCSCDDIFNILKNYSEGKFKVKEIKKLKAVFKGRFEFRELVSVNDVVIRNNLPTEAIRFRYRINKGDWSDNLIGDGLIVSTPFGSSEGAYYYSVARKSFDSGIGVAFNNTSKPRDTLLLNDSDSVEVEILRGVGVLVSDNNRDFINLEKGDIIFVNQIDDVARKIVC